MSRTDEFAASLLIVRQAASLPTDYENIVTFKNGIAMRQNGHLAVKL